MSYAFLLRLSRSAIKRIILIHRSLLASSVQHEQHQADTAAWVHAQALDAAQAADVAKRAAHRKAKAVAVAAQIELNQLPEYKV